MSRRYARELAVQALYQAEVYPESENTMIVAREKKLPELDLIFYREILTGVQKEIPQLDEQIGEFLRKDWSVNRLSAVDRAILRMAVYELQHEEQTPFKVVLNEAVELAKSFSGSESASFINGVLANFANKEETGPS